MCTAATFEALRCESCGAQLQVEAGHRTANCPYCASPAVVERPGRQAEDPAFVVGFVVTRDKALELARAWKRKAWLTPGPFRRADVSETRGIYVPTYLYTAAAQADYTVSIGENYTVVETYTTTDSKGNTVTRTRTRTVTEWRNLSGSWSAYVDDVVVTASRGLPNAELEAVEPFDFRALRRFTPKVLSGWIAEDPSMEASECKALAHGEAVEKVGRQLTAFMPGDKHRDLRHQTRVMHEDLELLLLPVWVLAIKYADDAPPVRIVINGQTGKLTGRPPRSVKKIVALVVFVVAVIAALVAVFAR
jgi:hypothetical protein